jgi:hypothetical protein
VKSDACKKLDYRIVHPADLTGILKEENWPADARWVRTAFLASDEGTARPEATPRFILAQDGKVILAIAGNGDWKDQMWPKILEVTGTKA